MIIMMIIMRWRDYYEIARLWWWWDVRPNTTLCRTHNNIISSLHLFYPFSDCLVVFFYVCLYLYKLLSNKYNILNRVYTGGLEQGIRLIRCPNFVSMLQLTSDRSFVSVATPPGVAPALMCTQIISNAAAGHITFLNFSIQNAAGHITFLNS